MNRILPLLLLLLCSPVLAEPRGDICVQNEDDDQSDKPPHPSEIPRPPPLPEVWIYVRPYGDGPCKRCDLINVHFARARKDGAQLPFTVVYKREAGCRRYPTIVWRGEFGRVQLTEQWKDVKTFVQTYKDSMLETITVEAVK